MSGFWHVGMCIELLNEKIEMLNDIIEYQDFDEDLTEDNALDELFATLLTRHCLIHDL